MYRSLIIDDDEITRILLVKYAKKLGIKTESCSSVQEAKDILRKEQFGFDFVISDLFLPDGLGLDILKEINKNKRSIDFVIISGHASVESTVDAIRAGAVDYVFKPINYDEFSIRMKSLIQRKELNRQLLEAEKKLMYQATITTANHEINQPLTVIISGLDILKMELKRLKISSPVIENYLNLMFQSSQRIAKILKRFREIQEPDIKSIPHGMNLIELQKTRRKKHLEGLSVLVIEDEVNISNIIERLLKLWGAKATLAEYGWDGIRSLENKGNFDLVLLDLNLPDIEYLTLFKEIKSRAPSTHIIIMSGYATEKEIQMLMDMGADDFIMKPFSAETLLSKILNLLKRTLE